MSQDSNPNAIYADERLTLAEVESGLEVLGCEPRRSPSSESISIYACCPLHDDRDPSLSVAEGAHGSILAMCHRCDLDGNRPAWLAAFFTKLRTLNTATLASVQAQTLSRPPARRYQRIRPVCAYIYLGWDRRPVARLLRRETVDENGDLGRSLIWQRPLPFLDGSDSYSWIPGLDGVERPIRLWLGGQVSAQIEREGTDSVVWLTEGESDAVALNLAGYPATCAPGGAGGFRREHAEALKGAGSVIVIADHDAAGLPDGLHRAKLVGEVLGADRVRLVRPPTPGTDVRDLLDGGGAVDDLEEYGPGELSTNPVEVPTAMVEPAVDTRLASTLMRGGAFVLDSPNVPHSIWGAGSDVLWAEGEALMIAGGSGLGKTTLSGQLVRGRLGLTTDLLGLPIAPGQRRVLYLAMDRPSQISRSLGRLFTEADRRHLDDRLVVWRGPPPKDLARHPEVLREMCEKADADTVVVDSLKDAAIGLSEDEVGSGYNRARQGVLVDGVQVLELHHLVKRGAGGLAPDSLADVYGSGWLTAGAGSVVVLTGAAGDPIVKVRHLKIPVEELGPWQVSHDHAAGTSSIWHGADLLTLAALAPISAKAAASVVYESEKPTAAQVEKVRRRLDKLVSAGLLEHSEGTVGGPGGSSAARYWAASGNVDGPAS